MKLQLAFRAYLSGIFFQHKYLPEEDQITNPISPNILSQMSLSSESFL